MSHARSRETVGISPPPTFKSLDDGRGPLNFLSIKSTQIYSREVSSYFSVVHGCKIKLLNNVEICTDRHLYIQSVQIVQIVSIVEIIYLKKI